MVYSGLEVHISVFTHAQASECILEMAQAHTADRWINASKQALAPVLVFLGEACACETNGFSI